MDGTLPAGARAQLRRQLAAFFLTTFAFSWGLFAIVLALGDAESPLLILGVWGPTLAAVAITALFYGKAGLRRFFARIDARTGFRWFLPLLAFFLAIGLAGRFLGSLAVGIEFDPQFWGWAWVASVMIKQLLIPGLGEEFGWRGFALQRLQHITTPLKATLLIAFLHLLWHAPTYWLGTGMHNVPAIWAAFFIVPWTILFTWAYNKSNGSILVAVFFHATMGATLSYTAFLPMEHDVPITPDLITMVWLPDGLMGPYLGVAALYWALALHVLRGGFGGLGTPPKFEHPYS
ncbi:MAG: CPBP family intramembrane metalloprotease [Woeseiaceae bacterium]|nr:CPBP family intramembrane metalloprotease [Woeseiaceae bacterium]